MWLFSLDDDSEYALQQKRGQGYQFFQLSLWENDDDVFQIAPSSNLYRTVSLPAAGPQLIYLSSPAYR